MKHLKLTQNQNVLRVALNRPEKRNAFHPEMIVELTKCFKQASKDKTVRAVVLTGEGESFCSGGDLEWMKSMARFTLAQNLKDAKQLFEMFWSIRSCPVPVIARAFGHVFGGGGGLVAACDIAAAETSTQICFSEVKWGLVPAVISPFVIEKCNPPQVREWFLTAKIFQSAEAKSGGLIHFHGSIDEVDSYIEKTLKNIMAAAPEAVQQTKKMHQSHSPINWKKVQPQVIKLIAQRRVSKEGQKGLQAFLDKRSPQWSDSGYGSPAKI